MADPVEFVVKKLPYDLSSHGGLALVGRLFKHINLPAMIDPKYPVQTVRGGIAGPSLEGQVLPFAPNHPQYHAHERANDSRFSNDELKSVSLEHLMSQSAQNSITARHGRKARARRLCCATQRAGQIPSTYAPDGYSVLAEVTQTRGGCAAEGASAATREKPVSRGTPSCAQGPTLGFSVSPRDPRFSPVSLRCLLPRSLLVGATTVSNTTETGYLPTVSDSCPSPRQARSVQASCPAGLKEIDMGIESDSDSDGATDRHTTETVRAC